jgi:catechol 2,3-dioxygenase-like lactoylglutathione lyase family enzyme
MIGLFPKNLDRMVKFYSGFLGVEVDWDGKSPYAEFKHQGIRFAMYARSELPALLKHQPDYTRRINGTFELAIDLPRFEDIEGEYERALSLGARPVYAPRMEPWGMRSSMVTDPEGNLIEIGSWNKG